MSFSWRLVLRSSVCCWPRRFFVALQSVEYVLLQSTDKELHFALVSQRWQEFLRANCRLVSLSLSLSLPLSLELLG